MKHSPSRTRCLLPLFALCAAALSACGGGGGGGEAGAGAGAGVASPPTAAPGAPVAPPSASAPTPTAPPTPAPPAPPPTAGALAWSDPATWGGTLPPAGAEIVIPAGRVITLDTNTPALGALRIEGTLQFARADITLTAASIDVTGALQIGSEAAPFTHRATITLTGAPQTTNDGRSRGLNVRGGRLALYGTAPQPVWTKLNAHAAAGARSLTLKDSTTGWRSGDTIAVAPTDYYGVSATERLTLSGSSATQLSLSGPLGAARWGRLQYVNPSSPTGISLTPDASFVPPASPAPTELDERAAVGNLSRNIVIQGANDSAWASSGFGAHVMIMELSSRVVVDGVEFRRVGQAGVTGRYPFHWHMLSYNSAGQALGDATGHIIRNSSVWESSNRCIVVHGTNGTQVLNNICQDIQGHAFFLEDAVERRNVFDGNLALTMRAPPSARRLQVHEGEIHEAGPSGFWLTNPDNIVRNNHAGDAAGTGLWMAFPPRPLGLSAAVPMVPSAMRHGVFENNTGHSARNSGILLEHVPIDAAGNVQPHYYIPTDTDLPSGNTVPFTLKRVTSFKNLYGAYRNRAVSPRYQEWVVADNGGVNFVGAVQLGILERALVIGTSLNVSTNPVNTDPPVAFASYHSELAIRNNTVVNFPHVDGRHSGAFKTDDYYLFGVDRGTLRNPGNRYIASGAGYRSLPPHLDGQPLANRHWTLAGAIWDPFGHVGSTGQYWVYDVPFLTTGATCQAVVVPAGRNGMSCDGEYYGVQQFKTQFDPSDYEFKAAIHVDRQNAAGASIGTWAVANGNTSTVLGNMRHFAARQNGRYVLTFPGNALPTSVGLTVNNAQRSTDMFMLAVSFDGSLNATGYLTSWANREAPRTWGASERADYVRRFTAVSTRTEFDADTTGSSIWQDRANNLVWVRVRGGLNYLGDYDAPLSDRDIYRPYGLMLYAR